MGEASLDAPVVDDYERWHPVDSEALCEVGVFVGVYVVDVERVVVLPPLQDLGEVALDASRLAVVF
jgi:hypothetical protein